MHGDADAKNCTHLTQVADGVGSVAMFLRILATNLVSAGSGRRAPLDTRARALGSPCSASFISAHC